MGRHGYTDDDSDYLQLGRWRGMVASAIRGKRGQTLLTKLRAALDAMPEKRLASGVLVRDGECCALGAVCLHEKTLTLAEMAELCNEDGEDDDPDWTNDMLADKLDTAKCLIQEIEYENDEGGWRETPEQRWERMRRWVDKQLSSRHPAARGEPAARDAGHETREGEGK